LADHAAEPFDVGLIERGIHLVEDTEAAWLALEDRQQERDGRQRLLAAGELTDGAWLLARRLGDDLDAALQPVDLVGDDLLAVDFLDEAHQADFSAPAAEQLAEHAAGTGEVLLDGLEGLLEAGAAGLVEALDQVGELAAGIV